MISNIHRAIFIHVPKSGGSSIEQCLLNNEFHYSDSHIHQTHKQILRYQTLERYFTFAFVRNPWDKMVSEYKWFTNTTYDWPKKHVKNYFSECTFSNFVSMFLNSNVGDVYHRFSFTEILNPICDMSFIGRFENLQHDFNIVCDKIDIPQQQLPHVYKTDHKHYTEYYDEETKSIVAERYAQDIEHFGYKFGE